MLGGGARLGLGNYALHRLAMLSEARMERNVKGCVLLIRWLQSTLCLMFD